MMITEDSNESRDRRPAVGSSQSPTPSFPLFSDPLAIHRGMVKAIRTSSISVPDSGVMAHPDGDQHHPPSVKRSSTSGSSRSVDSTKKKSGLFGLRKSASKHSNRST